MKMHKVGSICVYLNINKLLVWPYGIDDHKLKSIQTYFECLEFKSIAIGLFLWDFGTRRLCRFQHFLRKSNCWTLLVGWGLRDLFRLFHTLVFTQYQMCCGVLKFLIDTPVVFSKFTHLWKWKWKINVWFICLWTFFTVLNISCIWYSFEFFFVFNIWLFALVDLCVHGSYR